MVRGRGSAAASASPRHKPRHTWRAKEVEFEGDVAPNNASALDQPTAVAAKEEQPTAVAAKEEQPTAVAAKEAQTTAVAAEIVRTKSRDTVAEEDSASVCESFVDESIAGDTVVESSDAESKNKHPTAVAARRQARAMPEVPVQGDITRQHGTRNSDPEVGNFSLFLGNWGERGTLGDREQARRTEAMDLQISKNPANVIVLLESTVAQVQLLQAAAVAGDLDVPGLVGRPKHEHYVLRGNEDQAILIAARKDTVAALQCLFYESHEDHPYTQKSKPRMARSRLMVAKYQSKQNIGHLGKDIVIAGAHGNNKTMNHEWPTVWTEYWKRLAAYIETYGIQFLMVDWNMSLTEGPKQLRSRGIECDCVAWYPWRHVDPGDAIKAEMTNTTPLGFDSCGIFYLGGTVQAKPQYCLSDIDSLTAVAGVLGNEHLSGNFFGVDLHTYKGQQTPGKHWSCYKSEKLKAQKNLTNRLKDLLTPSTTQKDLATIPIREGKKYCPYLRLKQKEVDRKYWIPQGGNLHNGAHFPLLVYTKSASGRSLHREKARDARSKGQRKGKGPQEAWGETSSQTRPPLHKPPSQNAAVAEQGAHWRHADWSESDTDWWDGAWSSRGSWWDTRSETPGSSRGSWWDTRSESPGRSRGNWWPPGHSQGKR